MIRMDMELLNAISEMMAKNNDIFRQEMKTMIEENNKVLLNQFTAVIEEKVTKEIHVIAEGHTDLSKELKNRVTVQELKEVKSDLQTISENTVKHRERIEKLESEVKNHEQEIRLLKKANWIYILKRCKANWLMALHLF